MKCSVCGKDNKKGIKFCKYCGNELIKDEILSWKFHLKALGIIYLVIIIFFSLYLILEEKIYHWIDIYIR